MFSVLQAVADVKLEADDPVDGGDVLEQVLQLFTHRILVLLFNTD